MTGSATEVIAQEIYNSLEHIDMNDARLGAHDMRVALTRAGFAIVPVEPTEAPMFDLEELLEMLRSLLLSQIREGHINSYEELYAFVRHINNQLSAARQQEGQDDG